MCKRRFGGPNIDCCAKGGYHPVPPSSCPATLHCPPQATAAAPPHFTIIPLPHSQLVEVRHGRRLIRHGYFYVGFFFTLWLLVYLLYGVYQFFESQSEDVASHPQLSDARAVVSFTSVLTGFFCLLCDSDVCQVDDVFDFLFPPLISGRGVWIVLMWSWTNDVGSRVRAQSIAGGTEGDESEPVEADMSAVQQETDFVAQIRVLLMYTTAACIRSREGKYEGGKEPTIPGGAPPEGLYCHVHSRYGCCSQVPLITM